MKIDANTPVRTANPRRSRRVADGGGGDFATHLSAGSATKAVSANVPIGGIDAMLALQEVDPGERRQTPTEHGERLLDRLDQLRVDLLDGRVSRQTLVRLEAELAAAHAEADDPELRQSLEQIELRAKVELAKMDALSKR